MYKYIINITHSGVESNEYLKVRQKLATLLSESKQEPKWITYDSNQSTLYITVDTISEADKVAVVLSEIRSDILTDSQKYKIECYIVSNSFKL